MVPPVWLLNAAGYTLRSPKQRRCRVYRDTMLPGNKSRPQQHAGRLLGIHEIADAFGVERATVDQWRRRGVLPDPDVDLQGGPVWWESTLRRWARASGRGMK